VWRRLAAAAGWDDPPVSQTLAAGGVEVRYRREDGGFADARLDRLVVEDVVGGLPVREFRWWKGRVHYSGWYWASTTGRHVVYESRLELARIMLADQAPDVVGIAAQPFCLSGVDGGRVRRHVPDVLLAHADGGVSVVDVKAPSRLADPAVVAQFDWTRRVCARRGWGFEVWSSADAVLLDNVRFLAGYRRRAVIEEGLIPAVLAAAASGASVGGLERALAGDRLRGLVRPVVLHLLWSGRLIADLGVPLGAETVVRPVGAGR
jgi:hypothetical protein